MGTRATRPITFTCSWCYREVTEDRAPGPTPQYCLACGPEAKQLANTVRVRRHRKRRAEEDATPWWQKRPVGRPRKT